MNDARDPDDEREKRTRQRDDVTCKTEKRKKKE